MELIERGALLKALKRPDEWEVGRLEQWDIDIATVEMTPPVDAVEVVRCKHCKYYEPRYPGVHRGLCKKENLNAPYYSDFCSDGDRKDGSE